MSLATRPQAWRAALTLVALAIASTQLLTLQRNAATASTLPAATSTHPLHDVIGIVGPRPFRMAVLRNTSGEWLSEILRANGRMMPIETAIFDHVLASACARGARLGAPHVPQVIDVGANLGYFGLRAASHGCSVLMLEPNPQLAALIAVSIEANNWAHRVQVINAGVGEAPGTMRFRDAAQPSLAHLEPDGPDTALLPLVPVVTLDSLFRDRAFLDVLLLKIDVEGYEQHVISGLLPACSRVALHNVVLEVKRPTAEATLRLAASCMNATAAALGLATWKSHWFGESYTVGGYLYTAPWDSYYAEQRYGVLKTGESPHVYNSEDVWLSVTDGWWHAPTSQAT